MTIKWWPKALSRHFVRNRLGKAEKKRPQTFRPLVELLEERWLLTIFTVTDPGDSGAGTFRQAIIDANNDSNLDADTIVFELGPFNVNSGPQTINVGSALPAITDANLTIDGWSEGVWQGFVSYQGPPLIELHSTAPGYDGLVVQANDATIQGLVINKFSGDGILLTGVSGALIQGNYIGTSADGNSVLGNKKNGIELDGSSFTTIHGNLIAGNGPAGSASPLIGNGILIHDSAAVGAHANLITGNFIGTDIQGNLASDANNESFGNKANGIAIIADKGASQVFGNLIGGTNSAAGELKLGGVGNLISNNKFSGVDITGAASNVVAGNYIGTNASGNAVLGNLVDGILIHGNSSDNSIGGQPNSVGGPISGAGNLISGNVGGIEIDNRDTPGTHVTGTLVIGNFIGTDRTGTTALSNVNDGVALGTDAYNNTVGGTSASARNLISGNRKYGVSLVGASANVVEGNYIGTDVTGKAALGNSASGVILGPGATANTVGGVSSVGGPLAGAGNLISGNSSFGILALLSSGNLIAGNYIGTDVTGNAALGNSGTGITFFATATKNTVGGTAAVLGNLISGNASDGVLITGGGSHLIQGNFIGTDASGNSALGNQNNGIALKDSNNNTIGGLSTYNSTTGLGGAGNVISGNSNNGILVDGSSVAASGNVIQGNFIGTDRLGKQNVGNLNNGVELYSASSNLIVGNLISANGTDFGEGGQGDGILIHNGLDLHQAVGNRVQGNFIGTDVNGSGGGSLGNVKHGIEIRKDVVDIASGDVSRNTIGGKRTSAGPLVLGGTGNLIANNGVDGILLDLAASTVIQGNFIGTTADGLAPLGNGRNGVEVFNSTGNTIGGASQYNSANGLFGAGNVIAASQGTGGLQVGDGILVTDVGISADLNVIQGNFVGTDVLGTTSLANSGTGIELSTFTTLEVVLNTIGGTVQPTTSGNTFSGNLISGNSGDGVLLYGTGVSSTLIQGNYIGTKIDGINALPNMLNGVEITGSSFDGFAHDNTVGTGNLIAFNSIGVLIGGDTLGGATGNAILGNSIFENTGLGIDLGNDGVTANDTQDPDGGPNRLQNFPVLSSSASDASGTTITGTFNSTPSAGVRSFRIEFFASQSADLSGNGEGQTFLGFADVTTDSNGDATINVTSGLLAVPNGYIITATATDLTTLDTSEFSSGAVNTAPLPTISLTGGATLTEGNTTTFTLSSDIPVVGDTIVHIDVSYSSTPNSADVHPSDYTVNDVTVTSLSFDVTIPNGKSSLALVFLAANDGLIAEANETVTLTLDDTDPSYLVGANSVGAATIAANGTVVTNTNDEGEGSLRQAIINANNSLGAIVSFAIQAADPGFHDTNENQAFDAGDYWTIQVCSELPAITAANVTIDGWSEGVFQGLVGYQGPPLIVLDGSQIGIDPDGFVISASGVTINGMSIVGFDGNGIRIDATGTNALITGNYIGVLPTGAPAANTVNGIAINGAKNATLTGNVISANLKDGIRITGGGSHLIQANLIGTDPSGLLVLGNGTNGIVLDDSSGNTVGGLSQYKLNGLAGPGNVISGNTDNGILITGTTGKADSNVIQGNFIGTDRFGLVALANGKNGVALIATAVTGEVAHNWIGGDVTPKMDGTKFDGNLISGNSNDGVLIDGGGFANGAFDNSVQGNFIGPNITGDGLLFLPTASYHRLFTGVDIANSVSGSTAFVGFTGGTGNPLTANQDILRWLYRPSTGSPIDFTGGFTSTGLQLNGSAEFNPLAQPDDQIRLTHGDNISGQAGSAFFPVPVDVTSFSTTFEFRIGPGLSSPDDANGLAFVIQNDGNDENALGSTGGGLGFGSNPFGSGPVIAPSLAVTFDLFWFGGPGNVSFTDLVDGSTFVPDSSGTSVSPIDYHDYTKVIHVQITYDSVSGNFDLVIYQGQQATVGSIGNIGVEVVGGAHDNVIGGSGNVINNQPGDAIFIGPASNGNLVADNTIGTNAAGTMVVGNQGNGIHIDGSSRNTLHGNLIAASGTNNFFGHGILIEDTDQNPLTPASGNLITGNYIGTDITGTKALDINGKSFGNHGDGIQINNDTSINPDVYANTIGGTRPLGGQLVFGGSEVGNLISNNRDEGISIRGNPFTPGVAHTLVRGNFIGTDRTGTLALGNGTNGIFVSDSDDNTIGGSSGNTAPQGLTGDGNVISGNDNDGILLQGSSAATSGNRIEGNYIGTDISGTRLLIRPPATYTQTFTIGDITDPANVSHYVGGSTAYVGFTGATGNPPSSFATSIQDVLGWLYTSPGDTRDFSNGFTSTAGLTLNGVGTTGSRLRVTDGGFDETRSVFTTFQVDITSFSTSFDFQFSPGVNPPLGEGLMFVLQNLGPNAIGQAGDGLGYGGFVEGLGVKFDPLGTFASQTGLFPKGTHPSTSDTDVSPVDFHNGRIYHVDITYDGTDLKLTITEIVPVSNGNNGIEINGASNNFINANVISGNGHDTSEGFVGHGIHIHNNIGQSGQFATGNLITGNFIGTGFDGRRARDAVVTSISLGNARTGIRINDDSGLGGTVFGNTVGGAVTTGPLTLGGQAGNVISNNREDGVSVSFSSGNLIQGNFIGTDASGNFAGDVAGNPLGNGEDGVALYDAPLNIIIGNLISGNGQRDSDANGIYIEGGGGITSSSNLIQGNFIGTDITGTRAVDIKLVSFGNAFNGIEIENEFSLDLIDNTIGGRATASGALVLGGIGNLISNNGASGTGHGILISGSPGSGMEGQLVQGNFIGTDFTGTVAVDANNPSISLGNHGDGIRIFDSSFNTIGYAGDGKPGEGNLISNNQGNGVHILNDNFHDASANTVAGNYIGTNLSGLNGLGNSQSGVVIEVFIEGAADAANKNVIGGTDGPPSDLQQPADLNSLSGNLISGNHQNGVRLTGNGDIQFNTISGNIIGLDITGAQALSNTGSGILLDAFSTFDGGGSVTASGNISNNVIGGNVISGNVEDGILLVSKDSAAIVNSNLIVGNYIGTDVSGMVGGPLGNGRHGIELDGTQGGDVCDNTIGGLSTYNAVTGLGGAGNLIANNSLNGILIAGAGAGCSVVQGNFIGTDITGTQALGNRAGGIALDLGTNGNTIGGVIVDSVGGAFVSGGNLISGNSQSGVWLTGVGTSDNYVQNNLIGTDISGTLPLGNIGRGISILSGAGNNTIGGTVANGNATINGGNPFGGGNLISANDTDGILIQADAAGTVTSGNVVQGNFIGTDITGTTVFDLTGVNPLGNGANGVDLFNTNVNGDTTPAGNMIGGLTTPPSSLLDLTQVGDGNVISGNLKHGVRLDADTATSGTTTRGNLISGNYIGTDNTGTKDVDPTNFLSLGNLGDGVYVGRSALQNTVGGDVTPNNTAASGATLSGNVISNNHRAGIEIDWDAAVGTHVKSNLIQNNFIGTDKDGASPLGNSVGILLDGSGNLIDQTTAVGNTVNLNAANAVAVELNGSAANNTVVGLRIGDDMSSKPLAGNPVTGTETDLRNVTGLLILGSGNTIGLPSAGAQNVIANNSFYGVVIVPSDFFFSGLDNTGPAAGNLLQNNFIGVNDDGSTVRTDANGISVNVANGSHGVFLLAANGNTIGGNRAAGTLTPGSVGNLISNNGGDGVHIHGSSGNLVAGNFIGTDTTGKSSLRNSASGITLFDSSDNTIGGISTYDNTLGLGGLGNLISGNGDPAITFPGFGDGIYITDTGLNSNSNLIQGNFIGTDVLGNTSLANTRHGVEMIPTVTAEIAFNTVTGNVISGNSLDGVLMYGVGTHDNVVRGNLIGLGEDGTTVVANSANGVEITGGSFLGFAHNNTIGGTDSSSRNVISGNNSAGVYVSGAPSNLIEGNYIGLAADGSTARGNTGHGVLVDGSDDNTIGGSSTFNTSTGITGAGNVISKNGSDGVRLVNSTSGTLIAGNLIGTDSKGTSVRGNGGNGVDIESQSTANTVGGTDSKFRNVLAGSTNFNNAGVVIANPGTASNLVEGNYIGTDVTGTASGFGNFEGIRILNGTTFNTIGGSVTGARNIISGNLSEGIEINGGGAKVASANLVAGNYIGVDATGAARLGNADGVLLTAGTANTIGGPNSSFGNVISGNSQTGVVLNNGASANVVAANLIGVDATGGVALGNILDGVFVDSISSLNTIGVGAANSTAGNVIAGNKKLGVAIEGNSNVVAGNWIGTNPADVNSIGNGTGGASVSGRNNRIGVDPAAVDVTQRNIISGNSGAGVVISGNSATGNLVAGNYIGTKTAGNSVLGNLGDGVQITSGASRNTVGGSVSGAGNLIAGNGFGTGGANGVDIFTGNSNLVAGNSIGTDITATKALGNSLEGVLIKGSSTGNTVGGTTAGFRNIISGNGRDGVALLLTSGNLVVGNYIGTTGSGIDKLGNAADGVAISGSDHNTVGGTVSGAGNVIAGNAVGVEIHLNSSSNLLQGNYIGTNASDNSTLGNSGDGVEILSASTDNTVGGTTAAARNVISHNGANGVVISDSGTTGNLVAGNFIGTNNGGGGTTLGNQQYGVNITAGASANTVGGTSAYDNSTSQLTGAGNVISNNSVGVGIDGSGTASNLVQGNFIGTNASGNSALGNLHDNVRIDNLAHDNTIGGNVRPGTGGYSFTGNVISAAKNSSAGVHIANGATANLVSANYIGTDANGSNKLGNTGAGVYIEFAGHNTVGGLNTLGLGNVIAGNNSSGVIIQDNGFNTIDANVVAGNSIGINAAGNSLGNGGNGVEVTAVAGSGSAQHNTIGGINPANGNTIAFNSRNGVLIGKDLADSEAKNNVILSNSIHDNGVWGINLGNHNSVSPNPLLPSDDPDGGPNNSLPYPDLTSALIVGTDVTVSGTVHSYAGADLILQFFGNTSPNASGHYEGQYLLAGTVTPLPETTSGTKGTGFGDYAFTFTGTVPVGVTVITATTTLVDPETSEFSPGITLTPPPPPPPPPPDDGPTPNATTVTELVDDSTSITQTATRSAFFSIPNQFFAAPSVDRTNQGADDLFDEIALAFKNESLAEAPGEIHGRIFEDPNAGGRKGPDIGPLEGQIVFLDTNGNGVLDPGERFTISNAKGEYTFTSLAAGQYSVIPLLQRGQDMTFATKQENRVELRPGAMIADNVDLGIRQRARRRRRPGGSTALPPEMDRRQVLMAPADVEDEQHTQGLLGADELVPVSAGAEAGDVGTRPSVTVAGADAVPPTRPLSWWHWLLPAVVAGAWQCLQGWGRAAERPSEDQRKPSPGAHGS